MRIVTGGAVHRDAIFRPTVRALAVRSALPIGVLTAVALRANAVAFFDFHRRPAQLA
jgi:hypothetical protein